MSSGDFSNQASMPMKVDWDALFERVAEGAVNDLELSSVAWDDIPKHLSAMTLDILLYRLLEYGQGDCTVFEIARQRTIIYEDGSWT